MSTAKVAADDLSLFDHMDRACRHEFSSIVTAGTPLFTTDVDNLFELYLDNLPRSMRQEHNCHCCRQFIQRYGNLVTIDPETGIARSVLWNSSNAPDHFRAAVWEMMTTVEKAHVNGVFLSSDKVWGTPKTGDWNHFAIVPPTENLHKDRLKTPYQAMAQKMQDYKTLWQALLDFSRVAVAQAVSLLESESLYRSEKVAGPARFLLNLQELLYEKHGRNRNNIVWAAVAKAPVGYATPRGSMVGALLEDICAGMDFEVVKRRFAAKMDPLQYQRPQAPASAGNIAQAEAIVAKLGIANSLKRRYARFDEVQLLWRPTEKKQQEAKAGVFGHLLPKGETFDNLVGSVQAITWVKFAATVLQHAERMMVKMLPARMPFYGMLTAVDPEAPPILQWDSEERRNPFNSYVYSGGSTPAEWSLPSSGYVDVTGVTLRPSMWSGEDAFNHFGKSANFILNGAKDTRPAELCLFPENLKSSLHGIRTTIEAFSKAGKLEGREEASANGITVGSKIPVTVRVKTLLGTVVDYNIDRWD